MKFNTSDTIKFLCALLRKDEQAAIREKVTWILIPESPETKAKTSRPIQRYRSWTEFDETIQDCNLKGYGIYVCVNHTGCDFRTKNDVQIIRAIYADFDRKLAEPSYWEESLSTPDDAACYMDNLDYPPDLLVQSGNGYHGYWFLPEPLRKTPEVQEECEQAMRGIAHHLKTYGADPSVAEISRVMRVPGTFNVKDPHNPKLVKIIDHDAYEQAESSSEVVKQLLLNYPAPAKPESVRIDFASSISQDHRFALAEAWLEQKEPSIQDDGGSSKCLSAAWVGPGFDLDYDTALSLMLEVFNPQCVPAWSSEELRHKLDDAYASALAAGRVGCYLPDFQRQADHLALANGFEVEDVSVTEELETPLIQRSEDELDERLSRKSLSDNGMAIRFKARNKNQYCSYGGGWFHYNGTHWVRNDDIRVKLLASTLKRVIKNETEHIEDDLVTAYIKWARQYEQTRSMDAALKQAKSLMARSNPLSVSHGALVNFQNGTVDLSSGKLLAHDPVHEFTYCLPYEFDPEASSPSWENYLQTVFCRDQEVIDYLQVLIGATLRSGTDDEFCVWLHGSGSNGKTTLTETLSYALGPLARQVPNDMFLAKRYGNSHPTEIAMLHQVKFATCDDISLNAKLDEGVFKRLVNTGKITGRFMHKDFFEFQPTHKFWISVNNLPAVYDCSNGTWRRMIVIPFTKTFGPEERDETLKARLKNEVAGVWAWMVKGAIRFHQEGIPKVQPLSVAEEIDRWRQNENWFESFKAECCVVEKDKKNTTISSKLLYQEYCSWCKRSQANPMSHKSFGTKVGSEFESYKSNGLMQFRCIRLQNYFDDPWSAEGMAQL